MVYGKFAKASYIRDKLTDRMWIEVVLPDWLYDDICHNRVASIEKGYFKLSPLEKRMYHLAKKSNYFDKKLNKEISISYSLDYFVEKIGSNLQFSRFKFEVKKLISLQEKRKKEIEDWEKTHPNPTEEELEGKPFLPLIEYFLHYQDDNKKIGKVYFTRFYVPSIETKKEVKRKLIAKTQREEIEAGDFFSISNEEAVKHILKFIEMNFAEKKYPIFKTKILTEQKLSEYLRQFDANHLLSKIREFIDYDFTQCKNPEGYFLGILEEKLKKEN